MVGEGSPKKCKSLKSLHGGARSTLEARSDEERQRLISEEVAKILSKHHASSSGRGGEESLPGGGDTAGASDAHDFTAKSRIKSSSGCALWEMASAASGNFYNGVVGETPVGAPKGSNSSTSAAKEHRERSGGPHDEAPLQLLCQDWEKVFRSGEQSDMVAHSKDQRSLPCHSLVLLARCPALLDECVIESGPSTAATAAAAAGQLRIVTMPSASGEAVRLFLGYLYCGRLIGEVRYVVQHCAIPVLLI